MPAVSPIVAYGLPAAAIAAGAWYVTRPANSSTPAPNVTPAAPGCASGTCGESSIYDRAMLGLTGGAEYLWARITGSTDDEAIVAVYESQTGQDLTDAQRAVALSALAEDDDTLFEDFAAGLPAGIGEVVGSGVSTLSSGITTGLGTGGTLAAVALAAGALWIAAKAAA